MKNRLFKIMILLMIIGLGLPSCGAAKRVVVNDNTSVRYIDSTVVRYKDSTIVVEIPKEVIKDVVPQYDTLKMETSLAKSMSYVDTTTHTLKGSLENKAQETIYKTIYLPSEEHIVYRDSIQVKEVPVEVEVVKTKYPHTYWWLLGWAILCVAYAGYKIYKKFKVV